MKKLIKRILKEEIHPDYAGVVKENEVYFTMSLAELRIGLMALDQMSQPNKRYRWWADSFFRVLRTEYAIGDRRILGRMLLLFYFNEEKVLRYALEQNSIESLYSGPFYECVMDYNHDDIDESYEYEDTECHECSGDGTKTEECYECSGDGDVEDVDGEMVHCDMCDGAGEFEEDCDECGGHGTLEEEIRIFTLDQSSTNIISKEPFDISNYGTASDVFADEDVLKGNDQWYDSVREEEETYLTGDVDTIIETHSEDILSNETYEYIISYF